MKMLAAAAAVLVLAGCSQAPATQPEVSGIAPTAAEGPTIVHSPTQTPSEPAAKVGAVGEPVTAVSGDKVSRVTIISAKYSADPLGQYDSGPSKGGYLILDVLWESDAGTAEVNPLLFNAKDATGVQQSPNLGMDVDGLASASVPPGDKLRGALVFDIAQGPWIVTMGAFTEAARWNIPAS